MSLKRFTRKPTPKTWPAKGQWARVKMQDGTITARLCCPECGGIGLLDHEIAEGGAVTPSVVCDHPNCTYHESGVVLVGWLA